MDDFGDDFETAEALVLEPWRTVSHIDLGTPGEPWDKRRAAGKVLRKAVPHAAHGAARLPWRRRSPATGGR